MGHYYHGSITIDPETTREEMLAAADESCASEPEHRRGTVREWIEALPDKRYTNHPWVISWWGNFRGVDANDFCETLAKHNMGRVRTLVMVQVDEEPENNDGRPYVAMNDYSTWIAYDDWSHTENPRCAWPPRAKHY